MASRKLARLSMLLPTVVGLSLASSSTYTNAYQLEASDYAAKIAAALAAKDYVTASLATERLRGCGVSSLVVDGSATTLDEIEAFIAGGGEGSLKGLDGSGASFIVGTIDQASVECETKFTDPEPSLVAGDSQDNPSST